jgi:hydrogenase expression/formation protein HypE
LGAVLNEILTEDFGIRIYEDRIPIRRQVRAISEILGYDPLYLANEGKFLLVIGKEEEELALGILREHGYDDASCIGEIVDEQKGKAFLHTTTGGMRLIDYPYGTQLPRIC